MKQIQRFFTNMVQGFTLIEILVSIAILSVAILGIIALLPVGYTQVIQAGRMSTLNHLAQDKIDELRAIPIASNDLLDGTHPSTGLGDPLNVQFPHDQDSNIPTTYSVRWFVTPNSPSTDMKRVVVEVGYNIFVYGSETAVTDPTPSDPSDTDNPKQSWKRYETYITE